MDNSTDMETLVQQTVASLLFEGFDFKTYYVENTADHIYAIITSAHPSISSSLVALLARVEGDKVIIEVDKISGREAPFYKALMAKGIPSERLILDYLHGEDPDKYHRF
ncbi:MAG: hypothetical protein ACYDBJ_20060 [Aggregatilineales bacterium]